jgi:hypothetical protein
LSIHCAQNASALVHTSALTHHVSGRFMA